MFYNSWQLFFRFLQICIIFVPSGMPVLIVVIINIFEMFRFLHSFILNRSLPHLDSSLHYRLIIVLDIEPYLWGTQLLILLIIASFYRFFCVEYDINFINSTYIYSIPTMSQTVFCIPGQQQWKNWRKSLFSREFTFWWGNRQNK